MGVQEKPLMVSSAYKSLVTDGAVVPWSEPLVVFVVAIYQQECLAPNVILVAG